MKIIVIAISFFLGTLIKAQTSIEIIKQLFYNIPLDTSFKNSLDFIKKSDFFEDITYSKDSINYLICRIRSPNFLKRKPNIAECILLKDKYRHNLSVNLRYDSNKNAKSEYEELKKVVDREAGDSKILTTKETHLGAAEYRFTSGINATLTIYQEFDTDSNYKQHHIVTLIIHY